LTPVERGDVFHVDLNPIQGREQGGARYVVIVSPKVSMYSELRLCVRSRKEATSPATPGSPSL
jgi:mRNA-degrading endonuclease toxin of MazEF toxin-antitoxin module